MCYLEAMISQPRGLEYNSLYLLHDLHARENQEHCIHRVHYLGFQFILKNQKTFHRIEVKPTNMHKSMKIFKS